MLIETDKRYISEIFDTLPSGILNKTITNVGGTHFALTNNEPYIIAVPTVNLIKNKTAVLPNVFGLYYAVTKNDFDRYMSSLNGKIPKFIVTYNLLPRIILWLGEEAKNYFCLCDEFHLFLSEYSYRAEAINGVLNNCHIFAKNTYMSATPIKEDFLPDSLTNLSYTEIKWLNSVKIQPYVFHVKNPLKSVIKLIETFKKELILDGEKVEELFIFLNSVNSIAQIVKTLKLTPEDTKIVCADSLRNQDKIDQSILNRKFPISEASGKNKSINLYTSASFQGIDLYSDAGLIVMVSDINRKHTLLDIGVTTNQISGRIRNDSNKFKYKFYHIFNSRAINENEFQKELSEINQQVIDAKSAIINLNAEIDSVKNFALKGMTEDDYVYYNSTTRLFEYSPLMEKHDRYQLEVVRRQYESGISVIDTHGDSTIYQSRYGLDEDVLLQQIDTDDYKRLLQLYCKLRSEESDENRESIYRLEREYIDFKQAYEVLGDKKINSLGWLKKNIQKALSDESLESKNEVIQKLLTILKPDCEYKSAEIKDIMISVFKKLGISKKPNALMINEYVNCEIKKSKNTIIYKLK